MSKRGWTVLSLFLLIIAGTTYYFLFAGEKEDPNLAPLKAELENLQKQNLSPQQMVAAHNEIREKSRSLSDSARHELRRTFGEGMRKMIKQRVDAYFNAPPAQQQAILDQQIRQMEVIRKQMETMRKQGGGPGGRPGEGRGPGERGGPREGMGRGGPDGPGGPGGGRGRWSNASQEERDQRRKSHMEHGDPQERSRMMEYMSAVRDRREELGLPPMFPHRR